MNLLAKSKYGFVRLFRSVMKPLFGLLNQVYRVKGRQNRAKNPSKIHSLDFVNRFIEDKDLLEYFNRGLIPGPEESEEAFLRRIQQAKPLAHSEWDDVALPFKIDWVPIEYSNHKIAWWEGAVTWISDDELPSIQLRKKFEKGSFLGYKRSEVLSHEAIHAARVRFEEPLFEEVLAYSTAPQAWKRFFGPVFNRTWEPLVLMAGALVGFFWPLVPLLIVMLSLGALSYRQWIFKRCRKKLSFPLVLTLTDREMKLFASMTQKEIQIYLEKDSNLLSRVRKIVFARPEGC